MEGVDRHEALARRQAKGGQPCRGKTPREAVRTAQGRDAVDVLLKDLENHERRWEGAGAFDFSRLRRQLGLE